MSKRPPRRLAPEEEALWKRVADSATPLEDRPVFAKPIKRTATKKAPPSTPAPIPKFAIGEKAKGATAGHVLAPDVSAEVASAPLKMDRKRFQQLKRGKSTPEARIDLHGMTVDAAQSALNAFMFRAHGDGKRLVLVITGKGRRSEQSGPIPTRVGVLRHQVPQWLSRAPLASVVLQVVEAHQRHGGSGAFYVYLRRR